MEPRNVRLRQRNARNAPLRMVAERFRVAVSDCKRWLQAGGSRVWDLGEAGFRRGKAPPLPGRAPHGLGDESQPRADDERVEKNERGAVEVVFPGWPLSLRCEAGARAHKQRSHLRAGGAHAAPKGGVPL